MSFLSTSNNEILNYHFEKRMSFSMPKKGHKKSKYILEYALVQQEIQIWKHMHMKWRTSTLLDRKFMYTSSVYLLNTYSHIHTNICTYMHAFHHTYRLYKKIRLVDLLFVFLFHYAFISCLLHSLLSWSWFAAKVGQSKYII